MRRNVLFMAGLAAALTVTACQDQDQKPGLTDPSLGKAKQQQPHFTRGCRQDRSVVPLELERRAYSLRDCRVAIDDEKLHGALPPSPETPHPDPLRSP